MGLVRSSSARQRPSPTPVNWPSASPSVPARGERGSPGEKWFVFVDRSTGSSAFDVGTWQKTRRVRGRSCGVTCKRSFSGATEVANHVPERGLRRCARRRSTDSWLPRRLPAGTTSRDRAWTADRPCSRGGFDQCPRAGPRHRGPGCFGHGRYPGTIAATWQRAGRAGRRRRRSAAVLVASSAPVDQFVIRHPSYFFDASPEHAGINPDNLHILLAHVKCAAFELPFKTDEVFGRENVQDRGGVCPPDRGR